MSNSINSYLLEGQQAGERYRLASTRHSPQGTAGIQLGRLAGESLEFMDHREYQPGDDLRRIDWSAFARSDKMVVNLYRQEVSLHLDLLLDGSRSMGLEGSQKTCAGGRLGGGPMHCRSQHRSHLPSPSRRQRLPADSKLAVRRRRNGTGSPSTAWSRRKILCTPCRRLGDRMAFGS